MKSSLMLFIALVSLLNSIPSSAANLQQPTSENVLSTLDSTHPRLLLKADDLTKLKTLHETDATLQKYVADVIKTADSYCKKESLPYDKRGPRLLHISRRCLDRNLPLCFAYRWTGDKKYADKAIANALEVCAFPDWNPSHFLDTAEMSTAVGITYDWLYDHMDQSTRKRIKAGLIKHGMEPGIKAYSDKPALWTKSEYNWNQVCNGGLSIGALAIAETDPKYAKLIVPKAVASLPIALISYAPDGAWGEGTGYWDYATRYTVYGLAALDSALGTDFGLSKVEGLSQAASAPIYMTGPTELSFNYADNGENSRRRQQPCMFWLAKKFNDRMALNDEHNIAQKYGAKTEHILWYDTPVTHMPNPPLDKYFRGDVEVATFRSAWNDPDALFVGVKAGFNQVNHGHLDIGTFVLDALGERWALDLGSDDYNLPGYWDRKPGGKRWQYYRLNSLSHNIPLIDNQNQHAQGRSRIVRFSSTPAKAIIDMTSAYKDAATKVTRDITITDDRKAVIIKDSFNLTKPHTITWGMTTAAKIEINGRTAKLRIGNQTLTANLNGPAEAFFTTESAQQQKPQKLNKGISRLLVNLPNCKGQTVVTIQLAPDWDTADL